MFFSIEKRSGPNSKELSKKTKIVSEYCYCIYITKINFWFNIMVV